MWNSGAKRLIGRKNRITRNVFHQCIPEECRSHLHRGEPESTHIDGVVTLSEDKKANISVSSTHLPINSFRQPKFLYLLERILLRSCADQVQRLLKNNRPWIGRKNGIAPESFPPVFCWMLYKSFHCRYILCHGTIIRIQKEDERNS